MLGREAIIGRRRPKKRNVKEGKKERSKSSNE
jgi:hypothetical protein